MRNHSKSQKNIKRHGKWNNESHKKSKEKTESSKTKKKHLKTIAKTRR